MSAFPDDPLIIGDSAALRAVLDEIEIVAPTDSTVFVCGETGTGKELIARAIHQRSLRRDRSFVKVNCAAIPSGLLESELFGHEKGAFTGAVARRIGRFELADRGTLLLDEVGDIPLELQPKLLRVLQEGEFERLGTCHTIRTDVRLIAATHRDLFSMVQKGAFRSDLYYRLHIVPLSVPALRERMGDVPALVRHFVSLYARRMNKQINVIPIKAWEAFMGHDWPGNVRELQNVIEHAVILTSDGILTICVDDLKRSTTALGRSISVQPVDTLKEVEKNCILRALEDAAWVVGGANGAAARLGLPRTTLIYKMRKLGITRSLLSSPTPQCDANMPDKLAS